MKRNSYGVKFNFFACKISFSAVLLEQPNFFDKGHSAPPLGTINLQKTFELGAFLDILINSS